MKKNIYLYVPGAGGRRAGSEGVYPDRRFCRPFVSVFEAFPWPSSLAGKRAGGLLYSYSLGEETEPGRSEGDLSKVT